MQSLLSLMSYLTADFDHFSEEELKKCVAAVSSCFEKEPLRSKPAKLVVEIQYMTPEYYKMRKSTHAWYKIARAEHSYALGMDYMGGFKTDD